MEEALQKVHIFYSVLQNGSSRQPTIASCNYCPPLQTEPGTRPGGEWSEKSMKGLRVGLSAAVWRGLISHSVDHPPQSKGQGVVRILRIQQH